jgi:hypothetical protein
MPDLELVLGGTPGRGFEVTFADDDGEQRVVVTAALPVQFEAYRPVRGITSYKQSLAAASNTCHR